MSLLLIVFLFNGIFLSSVSIVGNSEPIPGPEFQVNTQITDDQGNPSVAMDSNGNFVITWDGDGQDGDMLGIYAQRYNNVGVPQGSEFQVNTYTNDTQRYPSVAMDLNGNFVIAWSSREGADDWEEIYAQRYNNAGIPQGSEFQVNTYTSNNQSITSIAMDPNGNFVIAWDSWGQDGEFEGIFAQRFNSTGEPQGSEFQVNTYTTDQQQGSSAAMDSNGNFVIAWTSEGQDGDTLGVYAQRYDSNGIPQGSEFQVNTYTTNRQHRPSVAMDSNGNFVISWMSDGQDGDWYGIFAQRYNSAGVPQCSEFQVNTYITSGQGAPSVAMDSNGNFVITWLSRGQDGDGDGIFAQRYDSNGIPQGLEFQVNVYTTNWQTGPSAAMDPNGNFVIAWMSLGQDGDGWGIYARLYYDQTPPEISDVLLDDGVTQANTLIVENSLVTIIYLNATIDDSNTGNSSISSANYTIGKDNWASSKPMNSSDGAFDEPTENVTITIDISTWPKGTYQLWVYASDVRGNKNLTGLNATLIIQDTKVPLISNVLLDDGIIQANVLAVEYGQVLIVYLNATIDDAITGNSNISSANYTLRAANWSSSTPMNPTDGSFDSPTENVYVTIDISSWPIGTYELWVYGSDDLGNLNLTGAKATLIIQDMTPPVITDVTALPDPQEVFGAVNVSAIVTDNYQLSGVWIEIFDPDFNFVGNYSMIYDPVDSRYYWNQTYDIAGLYTFTIWANDTFDNWVSVPGSFTIQDTTPPSITDVTAVPDPQEVFRAVNISANVTDNYQLFGVWVNITDPDGAFVGNFSMLYDPVNGRYYWNQTYDIIGIYDFTIWANDTSDNWASIPDTFVILDIIPPMIIDVTSVPDPQEVFNLVNVSANVTDNFQLSGVWIEIYDPDGIFVGNFSMLYDSVNARYYWNQTYDIIGIYDFTIWVNDTSDNWDSASGSFLIQDTTSPIITDITTVPDPQEVLNFVNISANVTDNYNLFDVWIEIYDPEGAYVGNFSMLYDPINARYYWNQTCNIIGFYDFTIWANDTNNNWISVSSSFLIHDTVPPLITDVTALPDPQEMFNNVNISANVTDSYQLFGVWVNITDPDGNFVGNFSMFYDSLNDRFYLDQAYDILGIYTFTIWANDSSDNWASSSSSFVIQDTQSPIITDVTAVPDPQEVFNAVNISVNVTDNYQLVGVWVEIFNGTGNLVGNFSMLFDSVNGRYYWNQTYDILGTYTFTIWANDTSGNWDSVSDTFVIHDVEPPTITDIVITPDPQEVFTTINISANVTDNYQMYGAWVEIYDPNANIVGNYSMLYDPVNEKYYFYKVYDMLGIYTFTIWANDTSDNFASDSGVLTIQDTTSPTIGDVTAFPNPQEVFRNINITTVILDNYQISGIWIEIHDPDGNPVGNFSGIDSIFGLIYYLNQTYDILGNHSFTFWVVDTSNNWASASGNFVMQDTTEPQSEIDDIPVYTTTANFTLSAIASDAVEVQEVELWYKKDDGEWILYDNDTTVPWSWNFDTSMTGGDGIYQFYSRANDTSGNYEDIPLENDTWTIVDTLKPQSEVDDIPAYTINTTFNLTATANDTNGVRRVELWYKKDSGSWTLYTRDTTAPWSWIFNTSTTGGDGSYQFYSRALDFAGNYEDAPLGNDTWSIVDTTKPVIIETIPNDGAEDVEITSDITIIFSETMDTSSVEDAFSFADGETTWHIADGEVTWTSTYHPNDTLIFNPNEDFKTNIIYTVVIANSSKDLTGNTLGIGEKPNPWSFTTRPAEPEEKENLKPLIALIFAIVLLFVGLIVVKKRPLKSKTEKLSDEKFTILAVVLPFVIAEIFTGIISWITGALRVPSWLGIGMIVDLAILIVGLMIYLIVYRRGISKEKIDSS